MWVTKNHRFQSTKMGVHRTRCMSTIKTYIFFIRKYRQTHRPVDGRNINVGIELASGSRHNTATISKGRTSAKRIRRICRMLETKAIPKVTSRRGHGDVPIIRVAMRHESFSIVQIAFVRCMKTTLKTPFIIITIFFTRYPTRFVAGRAATLFFEGSLPITRLITAITTREMNNSWCPF